MFHIIFTTEFQKGRVFMKNFLSKRKIAIIFLIILTLTLLIFLRPNIAEIVERVELRRIANMNKKVIPEVYDFIYDEYPENVGNARVEYVLPSEGREYAEIFLPDAQKAYTVNFAKTTHRCRIIMDYAEYTATVELTTHYLSTYTAVSFYLSGEIRVSSDVDINPRIYFESKSDSIQPKMRLDIRAQNAKIFPYKNGFVIDDYSKLYYAYAFLYDDKGDFAYRGYYIETQNIQIKSDMVWITLINNEDYTAYIAIMADTYSIGVFDTDLARLGHSY